ncbi:MULTISPECIES: ABC transporter permease [unclassified Rhizobium]|jgi:peptide/nickel transport system permease protein|uniref:ABC transporter permease n=1 Tax=unclassified Rhizobium TaxID=2613769 RepID=UPI000648DAF7|nr:MULTISPECIES: ABC transporter permease [unclassified Rhizobium]MBN8954616.1 ABC transporter permease [Rhizobium tropici]OJY68035.1 MAG: ABC transporter permease [Rhizobium sp. 60-20]RKD40480.1 peptide/nickel transport system permease protein [Rhizobium sp. WW_1]
MIRFLTQRLIFGAGVLLMLSAFVFFLFFVAPGDPARMIAGDKATEAQLIQIRKNLGVDRPIVVQYASFLSRAISGDLGFSYRNQQPVAPIIVRRIPVTLSLVLGGALLWLAIGIPMGIMSARYAGGLRDRIGQAFILVGLSFPTFVLGMMSLYLLYFIPKQAGFTLFPPGGYKALTTQPLLWAWHLVLPWTTLALTMAAVYARLTRGQMLDVMGEDYIRTARAKGLSERRVIWKHGLRAVLTPLVTQLGADIAMLLGGVIIIEQVYGLQGVGALAVQAVANQDRPIIIGVVLLGGVFIVISNIVVDLFYVLLDPRVR